MKTLVICKKNRKTQKKLKKIIPYKKKTASLKEREKKAGGLENENLVYIFK